MKKGLACTVAVTVLAFLLAGCTPAPGEKETDGAEARMEQFGFSFTIPKGVTGHGMDDGMYDIDFGETGEREAFITINPVTDVVGLTRDVFETDFLHMMREKLTAPFDNVRNTVLEMREIAGRQAAYIGFDGALFDLPIRWQMYMILEDEKLFSVSSQIYVDVASGETIEAIEDFMCTLQFVG